jgi:hypothetical protein
MPSPGTMVGWVGLLDRWSTRSRPCRLPRWGAGHATVDHSCPQVPAVRRPGFFGVVGGGELAVGSADEPPAALVDGPMMGPTQEGGVVQVGGAAIQPVPDVMALAPGQGPAAAGDDAAAVADGQGLALGGGDDPGRPADIQRPGGGAAQGRGELGQHRS